MFHLLLIAVLMMAGCYSSGTAEIKDKDLVGQVQIGKSTKEDVRKIFGEPNSVSRGRLAEARPGDASFNMEMDEWWAYFHTKHQTDAKSFIPYVGWLVGETNDEWTHFAVGFDQKGIVQHVSSGQMKGKGGVLSNMK